METILLSILLCIGFSACGEDDDNDNSNNEQSSTSKKRIVKIVEEENILSTSDHSMIEYLFTYDSQGRVIRILETETRASGRQYTRETTYQYGETMIFSKAVDEDFSWSGTHSYMLENGLIIKDVEGQSNYDRDVYTVEHTFSYDNNGYMKTRDDDSIIWTDGNLTSLVGEPFTYTNIPWQGGFFFYFGFNIDRCLWIGGYWGNTPKNMPHENISHKWTYDYTVTDGLVTKMKFIDKNGKVIYIANYTWE